jgi:hypothetical protein
LLQRLCTKCDPAVVLAPDNVRLTQVRCRFSSRRSFDHPIVFAVLSDIQRTEWQAVILSLVQQVAVSLTSGIESWKLAWLKTGIVSFRELVLSELISFSFFSAAMALDPKYCVFVAFFFDVFICYYYL